MGANTLIVPRGIARTITRNGGMEGFRSPVIRFASLRGAARNEPPPGFARNIKRRRIRPPFQQLRHPRPPLKRSRRLRAHHLPPNRPPPKLRRRPSRGPWSHRLHVRLLESHHRFFFDDRHSHYFLHARNIHAKSPVGTVIVYLEPYRQGPAPLCGPLEEIVCRL